MAISLWVAYVIGRYGLQSRQYRVTTLTHVQCCLRNLRSLKLLKSSVSPECLRGEKNKQHSWPRYDPKVEAPFVLARQQAKAASDQIFNTLAQACPGLVAIVIDHVDRWELTERVAFLRSKRTDAAGYTKFVGVPVALQTLKDHIPDPGVLGILDRQDMLGWGS